MPSILTELDDSYHMRLCECGHPRIAHYDESLICQEEGCLCECFKTKDLDPGGRDSFA